MRRPLQKRWYVALETAVGVTVFRLLAPFRPFRYQGNKYHYLIHPYNVTYSNERMVELPIALRLLREHPVERTLEVGNVLCHYWESAHDVVDKFEKDPHVTYQEDICAFRPRKKYDLVISVSTLEHVGFDERGRKSDPGKVLEAMRDIISFTRKTFLFTFPLGFNHHLDSLALGGELERLGIGLSFLKRTSLWTWQEVSRATIEKKEYPHDHRILVIGRYERGRP